MMAAKHLVGVIASEGGKKGTVSGKTEVGCSKSTHKLGGDTVAGGGGDRVPSERCGRLVSAGRQRAGCYAHPKISKEKSLMWVLGGKMKPGMSDSILQHLGLATAQRGQMTQTSLSSAPHRA